MKQLYNNKPDLCVVREQRYVELKKPIVTSYPEVPRKTLEKWQATLELACDMTDVCAGLVLQVNGSELRVLSSNHHPDNPYHMGQTQSLIQGSYFNEVITNGQRLYVADARYEVDWQNTPDLENGMVFFIGLPLRWLEGEVFGLVCLLNRSNKSFSDRQSSLLHQFAAAMETDLELVVRLNNIDFNNGCYWVRDGKVKQAQFQAGRSLMSSDALESEITTHIQAEKNYRSLFELALDATFLINEEADIVLANQKAAELFGYEYSELPGLNLKKLVSESVLCELFQENELRIDGISVYTRKHYEDFQGATKNGKQFPIEISLTSLQFGGRDLTSIIIRDISEYRDLQLSLLEIEEKFRLLFDEAPAGIAVLDRNAVILETNAAFHKMLGYEKEEVIGRYIGSFNYTKKHDELLSKRYDLLDGKIDNYTIDRIYAHKSGHEIWLRIMVSVLWDKNKERTRLLVYMLDISQSKKMELELERQNNLFHSIIEGTNDSIFVKDRKGCYELINTAGARYLGRQKEEIIGRNECEVLGEESAKHVIEEDQHIFDSGKLLSTEEEVTTHKGGRWWHTIRGPVFDHEGNITSVFGISRDISERKKMEEEQLQKDALYRQAEKLGQLGHWELDPVNGRLISCSEQYAAIFGMTLDEALQKLSTQAGWLSFIHADDRCYLENVTQEAMRAKQGSWDIEYRVLGQNGEIRHVHELSIHEYDDKGQVVRSFGVLQDITERKISDLALRESEERYRLLVETMTPGLGVLNETRQLSFVNEQLCKFLGYTKQELIGMDVLNLFDEVNKSILSARLKERGQGKDAPYELTWTRKDGQQVTSILSPASLFNTKGEHTSSFATVTDITERKKAERELGLYKQIVSSTSELMSFVDTDYIYRAINDQYLTTFDKKREEIVGHHINSLHGEKHAHRIMKPHLDEAFSGKVSKHETWIKRRNGDKMYIQAIYNPFRGEDGNVLGAVVSVRDITQLRHMQEELEKYQGRLEEEVRLRTAELLTANEELDAFAHTISHDLKAPLRAVDGFAEWLIEDYSTNMDEQGRHYLSEIQNVASRMGRMIDELLLHARMGERFRTLSMVDMNEVLAQLKLDLANDIETSGAEIVVSGELPTVMGHMATLEALFRNLLSNAMKFVSTGTVPLIHIRSEENDKAYHVSVEDNGIGIDELHKEMIFKIFERLHNEEDYSGTGVGLAIARKAVLLHQGEIWVESALGKSSTFHFTISKNLQDT